MRDAQTARYSNRAPAALELWGENLPTPSRKISPFPLVAVNNPLSSLREYSRGDKSRLGDRLNKREKKKINKTKPLLKRIVESL